VLLVGLAGGVASAASVTLAHAFSFGVTLAALTNIAQYVGWISSSRRKGLRFLRRFAPLFLCILAVPLVMADLTRHVLLDAGAVQEACDHPDETSCVADSECKWTTDQGGFCYGTSFWHAGASMGYGPGNALSFVGVLFTIIFTYTGFACMIAGVFWSVDIISKFKDIGRRFRELRHGTSRY